MTAARSKRRIAKRIAAALAAAALLLLVPVAAASAAPTFEPTGSMVTERYKAAAAPLPGGDALVVGGLHHVALSSHESESLSSAEIYDGATGTFSRTGSMAVSRMDPTATPLPDGRVLVAGGQIWGGGGTPLASAEIYDPETGEFTATGSMAIPRFGAMAAPLADGSVLIAGGYGSGEEASAEIYDPATGEFTATGSMIAGRAYGMAAPLPDGRVLILASGGGENSLTTEIYDPLTGTFAIGAAETAAPLFGQGGSLDDGRVLFFSEQHRSAEPSLKRTYEYETAEPALLASPGAPALTVERPAVAPLPGGRMLVAGGSSEDGQAYGGQAIVPYAEIYTDSPVPAPGEPGGSVNGTPEAGPAPVPNGSSATPGSPQQQTTSSPKRRARRACRRSNAHGKQVRSSRCTRHAARTIRSRGGR